MDMSLLVGRKGWLTLLQLTSMKSTVIDTMEKFQEKGKRRDHQHGKWKEWTTLANDEHWTDYFFSQLVDNWTDDYFFASCRCDRILWFGNGIKQLLYKRAELRLSDHRPVSSMFSVQVEIFDHRKLQRVLNVNNAAIHPEILLETGE